ncbi:MAG: beta-lactamase family protein [Verrucomicrobia bacterium]|nr:beta-lactamase family protein [Verrucomicrobiota bacterium]
MRGELIAIKTPRPRMRRGYLTLMSCVLAAARLANADAPTHVEIRSILQQRIDTEKRGVGLVVGWVDEHGTRVVSYGKTQIGGSSDVNGKTIFEIGSITKVFTAVLLELAVERGEMKLDAPVADYLPASLKLPSRNGRQITLLDLATHRSGLPTVPDDMKPRDPKNYYADYTLAQMFAFLSTYKLPRDIGSQFEYSNLGFGLLGQALTHREGANYEAMVMKHVCQPLGMASTRITLTPDLRARLASPYSPDLSPTENWDLPVFVGAGALRSDAEDLLKFVSANLELVPSELTPALLATQKARGAADSPAMEIGLGWEILKKHPPPIIFHAGGTGGYASFVGFDKASRTGVVVLSNTANDVYDIGLHLLNPRYVLQPQPTPAVRADDPILDINLIHSDKQEQETKQQLLRLLTAHDVSHYIFTNKINIESGFRVVPHSHPVLTLSTKRLKDDELLLSTFVHEQLHWYLDQKADATKQAVTELRTLFPKLPVGFPEGADTEESSYEHLLVCRMEYQADIEIFGRLRARQIMEFWTSDHYTRIYQAVLADGDKIDDVLRKYKLVPIERPQ